MPGGSLHSPIWTPYELYGRVDHVYGFKAYEARTGWTAAQGSVNAVETAAYFVYLYLVYTYGRSEDGTKGRGAPEALERKGGVMGMLSDSRTVYGRVAVWAVLVGYSTAFLTFAKTILYWLNEAFSGMYLRSLFTVTIVRSGYVLREAVRIDICLLTLSVLGHAGFDNIGHNDWLSLVFLWIIPK